MPRLFHVSEEADIERFEPRAQGTQHPLVWAIAETHLANYLLPRDCPRVTFHKRTNTTEVDRRLLADADHVVAIESKWLERATSTMLFLYELPPKQFYLSDAIAGYYVSESTTKPVAVTQVARPLVRLSTLGAQLRHLPCLWELREQVAASTLGVSIIRFRNAGPKPEGFTTRFPV